MSEKASKVIGRVLRLEAEKIDFLLQTLGKVAFYAQEKNDKVLGKLISDSLDKYGEKFFEKTKSNLADLRGLKKELL